MAARMLPAIMSQEKRIAMSDQGKVAVLKKPENCIEIYGKGETENPKQQWMYRRLYRGLVLPYDVCFAPNNHLVVSDINDNGIKIFNLEGDAKQVSHMIIGQDPYRHLFVQDINGMYEHGIIYKTTLGSQHSNPQKCCRRSRTTIAAVCHMWYGYCSH